MTITKNLIALSLAAVFGTAFAQTPATAPATPAAPVAAKADAPKAEVAQAHGKTNKAKHVADKKHHGMKEQAAKEDGAKAETKPEVKAEAKDEGKTVKAEKKADTKAAAPKAEAVKADTAKK